MAETVTPAVRGWNKVAITLAQIVVGSVPAAVVGVAASLVTGATGLRPGVVAGVVAGVCVAAGLADLLYDRWGRPRPLALHRQVPRAWGHQHGPWKAALRYGARMGVGPATILNTWTWWAALLLCAFAGPWPSVAGAIVFCGTRFAASAVSTVRVVDGSSMAVRARRLDAMERPMERIVLSVPLLIGLLIGLVSVLMGGFAGVGS